AATREGNNPPSPTPEIQSPTARRYRGGSPDRRVRRRLRVLASFPGGDASHLSGLRVHHRL
ncbi:TPA: hypothetical protein ACU9TI_004856, partial [Klebsiella oxytoca]